MLTIVIQHILGYGWITQQINPETWKYEIVIALESFCFFGVNAFAMISGYVGVHARYRYASLALQWMRVFFYSMLFTLITAVAAPGSVTQNELISGLFPTMKRQYWYFTAYAGCFVTAPLINAAMRQLNRRQAVFCMTAMMAVYSGLNFFNGDPFNVGAGKNTLWIVVLYALGAYIGHFGALEKVSTKGIAMLTAFFALIAICAGSVTQRICQLLTGEKMGFWLFHRNDSPTTVMLAVMMLLLFARLRISRGVKLLTMLAPLNFSVYLIHDHPLVRRYTIAVYARHLAALPRFLIVPGIILSAAGIYVVCIFIDYFREKAFRALRLKQRLTALEEKALGTLWD